jgi:hypothetical protein
MIIKKSNGKSYNLFEIYSPSQCDRMMMMMMMLESGSRLYAKIYFNINFNTVDYYLNREIVESWGNCLSNNYRLLSTTTHFESVLNRKKKGQRRGIFNHEICS